MNFKKLSEISEQMESKLLGLPGAGSLSAFCREGCRFGRGARVGGEGLLGHLRGVAGPGPFVDVGRRWWPR